MRRLTAEPRTSVIHNQKLPTVFNSIYNSGYSNRTCPSNWARVYGQRARQLALVLILGSAVWLLGLFTHKCTHPFSVDERSHGVDYVGLVVKPTCVNQFAVRQLLRYQRPRNIFLIVPSVDTCQEYLGSISLRVKCLHEDSLFPNITKVGVANTLEANFPQLQVDEYLRGRTLSGWYLQQLLKLAAVQALPDLSDLYVIWDMDMIPTQHIPLLYVPSAGGKSEDHGSSAEVMKRSDVLSLHGQPMKTVVNVGGLWNRGYEETYENLFHKKNFNNAQRPAMADADGSSFVSHWIVVQKPLMLSFLDAMCPNASDTVASGCNWHKNILDNLSEKDLNTGFSEYHSYVSFVKQNWPETQYEMRKPTWRRNPVGDRGPFVKDGGLCCPTLWQHYRQWWEGYEYYGLEIGHSPVCRWTDPQFEVYYGPLL